ncbi:MAG: M14 family metallopeptidase [Patiriisocius sp.]|uniref:M14 family metallopeptidase n=1 Tax=Patiriisocius sp. TaxID=2822396 RepID=UPI003EF9C1DE
MTKATKYTNSLSIIINIALLLGFTIIHYGCTNNHSQEKKNQISTETLFETSNGTETPTYNEIIDFHKNLATNYTTISLIELDNTDSGEPLHVIIYDASDRTYKNTNEVFDKKNDRNILLINNGIHPGESDGIDASMLLIRDLANGKITSPKNTIIAVIPVYNIGGALNRNSTSRTNQNGPLNYGFRGNARNYDLNRDFIKADTKNARAFTKLFRSLEPELFIDNHVSNGADYQYTLTHLFTQHDKLGGEMGNYLNQKFMPLLEDSLAQKEWDITPYVNVFNKTPETGFSQFMDSPRYSTGYTTLYNTLGMMVETHMLKPYKQRVEGTYELMKSFIEIADADATNIKKLHQNAKTQFKENDNYPIQWAIDSTNITTLDFKGYEGSMIASNITGKERLKFDRSKPFTKKVDYYNNFKPSKEVTIPSHYIVPKGYWNVLELLKLNRIKISEVKNDTTLTAEIYHIKDFETYKNPYEGHYPHYNTETSTTTEKITVSKGDFIISTNQEGIRYLLETLEPSAIDSFFNWNFFDTILQQKEGFSPYVWEDKAETLLQENSSLKAKFDSIKKADSNFANNWYAQLDWLHKHSPNYEKAHLRFPIVRVRR